MADWFPAFQHHLGPRLADLFTAEGLAGAGLLARRLPPTCLAVLEVSLTAPRGYPDLSIRIAEASQARAMAGDSPSPHLAHFLRRWAARPDVRLPSLWLEFDLDGPEPPLLPSLCAKLRSPVEPRWLVERLLPDLKGAALTGPQREIARLALAAIPAGGQLLYAFSLLPRGGDLRLEVHGLRPAEMPAYLERLAVSRDEIGIAAAADLFTDVERTHLAFDLGPEGVRPRIGIAGSYPRAPHREPRWHQLLDRLEERRLCSPAQRAALLAWPGFDSFWTAAEHWPAGALETVCVRYLSHLKVVCRPGHDLEAKAYLAFGPYRRSATGALVPAVSA